MKKLLTILFICFTIPVIFLNCENKDDKNAVPPFSDLISIEIELAWSDEYNSERVLAPENQSHYLQVLQFNHVDKTIDDHMQSFIGMDASQKKTIQITRTIETYNLFQKFLSNNNFYTVIEKTPEGIPYCDGPVEEIIIFKYKNDIIISAFFHDACNDNKRKELNEDFSNYIKSLQIDFISQ